MSSFLDLARGDLVEELDFGSCEIGDVGAQEIAEALPNLTHLTVTWRDFWLNVEQYGIQYDATMCYARTVHAAHVAT